MYEIQWIGHLRRFCLSTDYRHCCTWGIRQAVRAGILNVSQRQQAGGKSRRIHLFAFSIGHSWGLPHCPPAHIRAHIEESIQRFSFNCNMYESIFKEMDSKELTAMSLIQADNRPTTRKCSKEDIFEAFDFYTNRWDSASSLGQTVRLSECRNNTLSAKKSPVFIFLNVFS